MSPRGRGRPRIYPDWHDRAGTPWAFSEHPNWNVCREVLRRPEVAICEEWLVLVTFVFAVTDEIGYQPRHHLLYPVNPALPLGPGNVVWWPRRAPEIPDRMLPLLRQSLSEQQQRDWRCDCIRIAVCDYHHAADRAGRNAPDESPLIPENDPATVELQRRYRSTTSRRHEPKATPLLTGNSDSDVTDYEKRCNGMA